MNAKCLATLILFVLSTAPLQAEVRTKTIAYTHQGEQLQGHLAWDDAIEGKRPGVLVVHEWWGLNDYARGRTEQLAALGYVAFALDMYGEGKVTTHPREAGEWAAQIRQNVGDWQQRALAGLEVLRNHDLVDTGRLAAIGYCFGGATVLQLAYSGADLDGVVSFHGSLPAATGEQAEQIQASILVCHGAADSFIPEQQVQEFRAALDEANVDWLMVYYAGARHSFTNPGADDFGIDGIAYDPKADERSWQHMLDFFGEVLDEP